MTCWQSVDLEQLSVAAGDCHIWRLPVTVDLFDRCYSVLSLAESQRAARFRFDRDRLQNVIARGGLRCLLSAYLNNDPSALSFFYGEYGKPFLEGCPVSFNVSHAGDWVVYIVTHSLPVGIDIEQERDLDYLSLAKRFFSSQEFIQLSQLATAQLRAGFFHVWVQKEAFVKAVGDGLQYGLDQFSVAGWNHSGLLTSYLKDQWHVENFSVSSAYHAAYAVKNNQPDLQFYEFKLGE